MSDNHPTIEVETKTSKATLIQELDLLFRETNDYKKGLLFEKFVHNLFVDFASLEITPYTLYQEEKQVDFKALNNQLVNDGEYIWVECKHTDEIGAPSCFKIAGHLWLSGGRAKTAFIFSLGGFTKTAMTVARDICKQPTRERLVLVNKFDIEKFLKNENDFKKWIRDLCTRADETGQPGGRLPENDLGRKTI